MYSDLFPHFVGKVFARTLESKPLRHAVLAVSSAVVDGYLQRPSVRSIMHKQQAITSLQQSLATVDITEDVALAIFIMLSMDASTESNGVVPKSHLKGFSLVLEHLHLDWDDPFVWNRVSPVLILVWRMAIRMDSWIAMLQKTVPVLPPYPAEKNALHRTWVLNLAKDERSADWALASFALDNLNHRAFHWIWEGVAVRASAEYLTNPHMRDAYETLFQQRIAQLREEHANWLQQPSCSLAMQLELLAQDESSPVQCTNVPGLSCPHHSRF